MKKVIAMFALAPLALGACAVATEDNTSAETIAIEENSSTEIVEEVAEVEEIPEREPVKIHKTTPPEVKEECFIVSSNPKVEQDKSNQFMGQVWLFPRFKYTNNCDESVKAVKIIAEYRDSFGDLVVGPLRYKEVIKLPAGEKAKGDTRDGWLFTEFDEPFDGVLTSDGEGEMIIISVETV